VKVISFVNMKGGTGKTTLAYLLATSINFYLRNRLNHSAAHILVIDSDPQTNLTMKMLPEEFRGNAEEFNLATFYLQSHPLEAVITSTYFENIDLIPADVSLGLVEQRLNAKIGGQLLLKQHLRQLKGYDYVIIDTPPNIGSLTANAVAASDYVIVPLTPDSMALKGLEYTVSFVREGKILNPELSIMGIVLNLVDKRYLTHRAIMDLTKKKYPEYLLAVISRRASFHKAIEAHEEPMTVISTSDKGARNDLLNFLKAVFERMREHGKEKEERAG